MTEFDGVNENNILPLIAKWKTPDCNPSFNSLVTRTRITGKHILEAGSFLFDYIRNNIERGRVFKLDEVLEKRTADCLGYCKLFTLLGRMLGMDTGTVDVVIDSAGRHVPHTAVMLKIPGHGWRFIDLWYGSKNIRHKRMGVAARHGEEWKIKDMDYPELKNAKNVSYLPDLCVNGITLYILGNRYLKEQEFQKAIEYYTGALELYPENPRFLYNRAIAYENLGRKEQAGSDYAHALHDDSSVIRVTAEEHEEITSLIKLDENNIDGKSQEIYLLNRGFITGEEVSIARIARKFDMAEAEVEELLFKTEARIKG